MAGPIGASAATTPSLGGAATFGVLASTFTRNVGVTAITGDLGYTTLSGGGSVTVTGATHVADAAYNTAGTDQGTALSALASQSCDFSFGSTTDLSLLSQPLVPGVYCITGAVTIGTGGITLNGSGTYIFRMTGALDSVDNSNVTLTNGASSCDVFWTPTAATTLGANTTFSGTVIDDAGITVGSTTTWNGRALAFGGTVTTDTDTINATCTTSTPTPSGGAHTGTITVIKQVINDNGGTKTVADFPLFVNGTPVSSGVSNTFSAPADAYTVTETSNPNYTQTFSGDCDALGKIALNRGDLKFCVVTNNDIGAPVAVPPVPPLIDVLKVPSPLSLPNGPGPVTYTYTLRNIGTVPVTDITMVGDSCSPITLQSGDANGDGKLQVNETWTYTCATNLTQTHTNTVVATGWANGLSVSDIADATVVVGAPVVPPLIHVTKVPSPLTLPVGGGAVTYTEKVTNPGTVALSNVQLTDSKCFPMTRVSGDTNGDNKLDTTETWTYTCTANMTTTTTDLATASGVANGQMAKDYALATVVVAAAVPALPKTGAAPLNALPLGIAVAGVLAASLLLYVIRKRQTE